MSSSSKTSFYLSKINTVIQLQPNWPHVPEDGVPEDGVPEDGVVCAQNKC